jgi:hypothetical protein
MANNPLTNVQTDFGIFVPYPAELTAIIVAAGKHYLDSFFTRHGENTHDPAIKKKADSIIPNNTMSVGARSFYEQCLTAAIKYIDQVHDFGDTPHAIVEILISHVKTAEHLAQLEETNPDISYLTCLKWWDFIKRDCSRWRTYLIEEPLANGEKVKGERHLMETADSHMYNTVVMRDVEDQQIAQKQLERHTAILQAKKAAQAPKVQTAAEEQRKKLLADRTRRNMGKVYQMVAMDIDRRSERGRWVVYKDDRFLTTEERRELLNMPSDVTKMTWLHKKVADEILKRRGERVEKYNRSIGVVEPKSGMKSRKPVDKLESPISSTKSKKEELVPSGLIAHAANKPKIRTIRVTIPSKGKGAQPKKTLHSDEQRAWDNMSDFGRSLVGDDIRSFSMKSKSRDSAESAGNPQSASKQVHLAGWGPRPAITLIEDPGKPTKRKRTEERSLSEGSKRAKN